MGSGPSTSDIEKVLSEFPQNYIDVGIDESLLMYSGIDSAARLTVYSSSLQALAKDLPAFIEKVGGVLQGVTPVPNAVGLGAFVISMMLQMAFIAEMGSSGSNIPNPMNMLRRVFAEEKSSEARDLMEEYLKRYRMYLRNDHWLLQETERLEKQLSLQLTRLRNSILVDKQISSRAVKHWVNGAAFHAQMLIHITRLRKRTGQGFEDAKRAADTAASTYHKDLTEILRQYQEYKVSTFLLDHPSCISFEPCLSPSCVIGDTEIHYEVYIDWGNCGEKSDYVEKLFSKHKDMIQLRSYFLNLQNNLEVLVNQTGDFQM